MAGFFLALMKVAIRWAQETPCLAELAWRSEITDAPCSTTADVVRKFVKMCLIVLNLTRNPIVEAD